MENKEQQISLELKPEIAKGAYSNLAIITHSRSEFIIDFATMLPGMQKGEVVGRQIMTPENAKRLLMALTENVRNYEGQFGTINMGQPQKDTLNLGDFPISGTKS